MADRSRTCARRRALLGACVFGAAAAFASPLAASAQAARPVRVALVVDLTGAFEEAARQTEVGLRLGLEYATSGSMQVAGHPIVLGVKDSAMKPDVARSRLAEAFGDDDADIALGGTGSSQAIAMAPIARQYDRVFFVAGSIADEVTGSAWNRNVFRVSRSAGQDAVANARAIAGKGTAVGTLAFDHSAGRSTIGALRTELNNIGADLVAEEYAAADSIDFTAPGLKLFQALSGTGGDRVIWVNWFGPVNPIPQLARMSARYPGIRLATYGNSFSYMRAFKGLPGMEGATDYYFDLPRNAINDWLVKEHRARHGGPPDLFVASAFSTGIAIVEPTAGIARLGIGYVPENLGIFAQLTVAENLRLAARSGSLDKARLEWLVGLFPSLERFWRAAAGNLSGGQKQMLAIAKALIEPKRLVLVDEPTKGLSPSVVAELADAFKSLVREGTSMLLVEQNFHFAAAVADEVTVIESGRTSWQGRMGEIAGSDELRRDLLGVSLV